MYNIIKLVDEKIYVIFNNGIIYSISNDEVEILENAKPLKQKEINEIISI